MTMSVSIDKSAVDLRRQLAQGSISPLEVANHFREAIRRFDEELLAWVAMASEGQTPVGKAADLKQFPLFGIPVGVKDVIDTADQKTEYGSEIYLGNRPSADAACVARIREAGGIILGKTATTEFATRRPCATRNPINTDHTPGGSSSGSAAAVAAAMTPLAIGTQTAGSVIRPAAYCGVLAIKPTFGLINRVGVKQLSDSVDTVGFFARSIPDLALIAGAIAGEPDLIDFAFETPRRERAKIRLAFCQSPQWEYADQAFKNFFNSTSEAARAKFGTPSLELPALFQGLDVSLDVTIEAEIWQSLTYERTKHFGTCSPQLKELFAKGVTHDRASVARAHEHAEAARQAFDKLLDDRDCLVTLSAPGEAPLGLSDTGPAIFNKAWTLLHVPCVTVPAGRGPNGLPFGLQVVAKRHQDRNALAGAEKLQSMLRQMGCDAAPAWAGSR